MNRLLEALLRLVTIVRAVVAAGPPFLVVTQTYFGLDTLNSKVDPSFNFSIQIPFACFGSRLSYVPFGKDWGAAYVTKVKVTKNKNVAKKTPTILLTENILSLLNYHIFIYFYHSSKSNRCMINI
jgi:hypothetical protein